VNSQQDCLTKYKLWFYDGEVGSSSETIWQRMTGILRRGYCRPPVDWDDFKRCWLLLKRFPEWESRIGEMAGISEEWAAIVRVWDTLAATFEARWTESLGWGLPEYEKFDRIKEQDAHRLRHKEQHA